jgi:hypothetical protein
MMIVETIPRKNKATNPNCNHCSDVGFPLHLTLEDLVLGRCRSERGHATPLKLSSTVIPHASSSHSGT